MLPRNESVETEALIEPDLLLQASIHALGKMFSQHLTLLHSERPKLHTVLAFLSAIGLT